MHVLVMSATSIVIIVITRVIHKFLSLSISSPYFRLRLRLQQTLWPCRCGLIVAGYGIYYYWHVTDQLLCDNVMLQVRLIFRISTRFSTSSTSGVAFAFQRPRTKHAPSHLHPNNLRRLQLSRHPLPHPFRPATPLLRPCNQTGRRYPPPHDRNRSLQRLPPRNRLAPPSLDLHPDFHGIRPLHASPQLQ